MNPLVHLRPGCTLRGLTVRARGCDKSVAAFLGVPYAEPPVGERRFAPPATCKLWSGVRSATEFGPICPQDLSAARATYFPFPVPDNVSEDCLYLNIWTPCTDASRRLPVMVYLYGGSFVQGMSNYFDGTAYAALHDVIFVSINYRVGVFGFLCTEDNHISGNMGLLDQLAALRWIKEHIDVFGGDPDNVTLLGNSAGAISIGLHLVSPMATGMFRRAILQSGAALYGDAVWPRANQQKYTSKRIRETDGTLIYNSKQLLHWLSGKTGQQLAEVFQQGFYPVVDDTYMPAAPRALYNAGRVNAVDGVLAGFNTNEGYKFVRPVRKDVFFTPESARKQLQNYISGRFFRGYSNVTALEQLAAKRYLDGVTDSDVLLQRLSDAYGDLQFTCPVVSTAESLSDKTRMYLYNFNHRPSFSSYPSWVVSDHGQEVPYVIGEPFLDRLPDVWTDEEKQLSRGIMTYWSNFARTGNPNGSTVADWPKYTRSTQQYLVLCDQPTTSSHYQPDRMELWNKTAYQLTSNSSKL